MKDKVEGFPHCDQRILHAPGVCDYCDRYPEWQELRDAWGINYTGGNDPEKAICPGELYRSLESMESWVGNIPFKSGKHRRLKPPKT